MGDIRVLAEVSHIAGASVNLEIREEGWRAAVYTRRGKTFCNDRDTTAGTLPEVARRGIAYAINLLSWLR